MLTVYVRKDLKMRKGKICAQVSHAVMAYWLARMSRTEDSFVMPRHNKEHFDRWVKEGYPIEIIEVLSEEELLYKSADDTSLIVDSGKTEFSGKPTPTCLCGSSYATVVESKFDGGGALSAKRTKQVIVLSKDNTAMKYEAAKDAAIVSVMSLFPNYTKDSNELVIPLDKESLRSWLSGMFTKIAVRCDGESLPEVEDGILSFKRGSQCMAIGPDYVEVIDEYTSNYKLI